MSTGPTDPTEPTDPADQPEGTGKQFARGVGEDRERKETREERLRREAEEGHPEPAEPGETPAERDPTEPSHRNEGSGKQFARGVGEDRDRRPKP